jgi:hypothetical protein
MIHGIGHTRFTVSNMERLKGKILNMLDEFYITEGNYK